MNILWSKGIASMPKVAKLLETRLNEYVEAFGSNVVTLGPHLLPRQVNSWKQLHFEAFCSIFKQLNSCISIWSRTSCNFCEVNQLKHHHACINLDSCSKATTSHNALLANLISLIFYSFIDLLHPFLNIIARATDQISKVLLSRFGCIKQTWIPRCRFQLDSFLFKAGIWFGSQFRNVGPTVFDCISWITWCQGKHSCLVWRSEQPFIEWGSWQKWNSNVKSLNLSLCVGKTLEMCLEKQAHQYQKGAIGHGRVHCTKTGFTLWNEKWNYCRVWFSQRRKWTESALFANILTSRKGSVEQSIGESEFSAKRIQSL